MHRANGPFGGSAARASPDQTSVDLRCGARNATRTPLRIFVTGARGIRYRQYETPPWHLGFRDSRCAAASALRWDMFIRCWPRTVARPTKAAAKAVGGRGGCVSVRRPGGDAPDAGAWLVASPIHRSWCLWGRSRWCFSTIVAQETHNAGIAGACGGPPAPRVTVGTCSPPRMSVQTPSMRPVAENAPSVNLDARPAAGRKHWRPPRATTRRAGGPSPPPSRAPPPGTRADH